MTLLLVPYIAHAGSFLLPVFRFAQHSLDCHRCPLTLLPFLHSFFRARDSHLRSITLAFVFRPQQPNTKIRKDGDRSRSEPRRHFCPLRNAAGPQGHRCGGFRPG